MYLHFGVLLYYSAFGELPYDLDNVNENNYHKMAENIKNNELKFPNDIKVSNMFKSFLKKCLEKNIENRYDIYDIVIGPLYSTYLMLFIFRILLFKIKRITSAQQLILIIILWYQLT